MNDNDLRVMFSSSREDWQTPPDLFMQLHDEFVFALDVCAHERNAQLVNYLSPDDDALRVNWRRHCEDVLNALPVCYMNPPYGRTIAQWVAKASREARNGATVVALLPARTDTRWFHDHIYDETTHRTRDGVELRLLKGRLKFVGATSSAPFSSMIVVFKQPAQAHRTSEMTRDPDFRRISNTPDVYALAALRSCA